MIKKENLESHEKNLLIAIDLVNLKKIAEGAEQLTKIRTNNLYYRSEKYDLMGIIEYYRGNSKKSLNYMLTALKLLKEIKSSELFDIYNNISGAYALLNDFKRALRYNRLTKKYIKDERQEISYLSREAYNYFMCGYHKKALILFKEIVNSKDVNITKFDADRYQFCLVKIYVALEEYSNALLIIENFKKAKKNIDGNEISFYYHLLNYLYNDKILPPKPIGISNADHLSLKWEIIYNLSIGNMHFAIRSWKLLKEINPTTYGDNFKIIPNFHKFNVFSKAIDKIFLRKNVADIAVRIDRNVNNLDSLHTILRHSTLPCPKEYLIEKLWNIEYDIKYNARFYTLMNRLKGSGVGVKKIKNSYYLAAFN